MFIKTAPTPPLGMTRLQVHIIEACPRNFRKASLDAAILWLYYNEAGNHVARAHRLEQFSAYA